MKIELKILNEKFYKVDKMGGSYYDLPRYETFGSAAMDIRCTEDLTLYPGERKMIPTGLAIWIGSDKTSLGMAGLIIPRSGLGTKGLILANTIGLIDEDYQGELMISAWNRNIVGKNIVRETVVLKAGDRIAQLMFVPVVKPRFKIVEEFSDKTSRNGGFGSTGEE